LYSELDWMFGLVVAVLEVVISFPLAASRWLLAASKK
jgi:hypothetical protein